MGYDPITYDREADVLYVQLRPGPAVRSSSVGDFRLIDYSGDGSVVGIEFIDTTAGIDLRELPFSKEVEQLIGESGLQFKMYAG